VAVNQNVAVIKNVKFFYFSYLHVIMSSLKQKLEQLRKEFDDLVKDYDQLKSDNVDEETIDSLKQKIQTKIEIIYEMIKKIKEMANIGIKSYELQPDSYNLDISDEAQEVIDMYDTWKENKTGQTSAIDFITSFRIFLDNINIVKYDNELGNAVNTIMVNNTFKNNKGLSDLLQVYDKYINDKQLIKNIKDFRTIQKHIIDNEYNRGVYLRDKDTNVIKFRTWFDNNFSKFYPTDFDYISKNLDSLYHLLSTFNNVIRKINSERNKTVKGVVRPQYKNLEVLGGSKFRKLVKDILKDW
jgi:hypothetical protein